MTEQVDITASLSEAPPSSKKVSVKKKHKARKRPDAEIMAEFWKNGEEDFEALNNLCERLSEKSIIHKTACRAEKYMTEDEHSDMMHWLRRRLTFKVHDCGDGTSIFSDLFAIPLKGKKADVSKYVLSSSFNEDMISMIRSSSMASNQSHFYFMRLAVPMMDAVNLDLDILNSIFNQLEWSLTGEPGIQELTEILHDELQYNSPSDGEEYVVLAIRTVRMPENSPMEDLFHMGLEHSMSYNSYKEWGDMGSEIGARNSVFICMPDEITGAIAFLGASRVNFLLKQEENLLRQKVSINEFDTFEIHICEASGGFWISKTFMQYCIGPTFIDSEVVLADHDVFMSNITDNDSDEDDAENIIFHENLETMPGILPSGAIN